jgi:putative colanic acid biosynthesis UDP-glucose lipid carrier transferase
MALNGQHQNALATMAPLIDATLVVVAGWLAYYTRWGRWDVDSQYLSVLVLAMGLILVVFPLSGAYRSWRGDSHLRSTSQTLPGIILVAALLTVAGTLTKTTADFSRLWMGYWFIYAITALYFFRWASGYLLQRFSLGHLQRRRILVVGASDYAHAVAQRAVKAEDARWEIAAFVTANGTCDALKTQDTPLISIEELDALISQPQTNIEEVWIAMTDDEVIHRNKVIRLLQNSCLTVRYLPDLSELALLNHVPSEVAGMTAIDLNASPLTGHNNIIKTVFDQLFALVALIMLGPFLLIIALLIKLDSPGPVFFRQQRHGWDRKVIEILKFRTMNAADSASGNTQQARRHDPRITRIGRILRRTSADELPQFINVLKGDMSVVGPRPHPLSLNDNYSDRIHVYMQRHRVRPGITGWAQVHGLRGQTESLEKMQARVDHDLHYIQHWSLWLDIKIIILTVIRGWTGRNAY